MNIFSRKPKLDSRIVSEKEKIKQILFEAYKNNRYSLYEFDYLMGILTRSENVNDYEKYKYFSDLISGWDEKCNLSRAGGEFISNGLRNSNMILGIHRANLGDMEYKENIPYNTNLLSIMEGGLINNGHAMQGGFSNVPEVSLTVSPLVGMEGFINLVSSYKGNNTTVLFGFPRELLDEDLHFINDEAASNIYIEKNGIKYINPDYILGAIIKQDGLDEFYTKEQLLNVMSKTM